MAKKTKKEKPGFEGVKQEKDASGKLDPTYQSNFRKCLEMGYSQLSNNTYEERKVVREDCRAAGKKKKSKKDKKK